MMVKKTLPSYQPALMAPRMAVGTVIRDGCLNWSSPFVYFTLDSRQDRELSISMFGIPCVPMPTRRARQQLQ